MVTSEEERETFQKSFIKKEGGKDMDESCCKCVHLSYETKIAEEGFDPRCDKKMGIIIKVDYGKKGCECFDLQATSLNDLKR